MADKILKSLGLREPLSDVAYDTVVSYLTLFARAGGVITWDVWKGLRGVTRAALVEAFEVVRAENAAAIGMATQGPRQAAQVLAVSDGGDLDCRLSLDRFIESLGG